MREAILARMLTLAEGLGQIVTAKRNQLFNDDLHLPALIIFDGDETARDSDPPRRPATTVRRIDMRPVVTIQVSAGSDQVGTELNAIRAAYLKALTEDAELIALTHDRVGFRYEGCAPVVEQGRLIEGALQLQASFTYILNPAEL